VDEHGYGIPLHELERELAWQLRKMPADPSKAAAFLGDLIVTMIAKNNAALTRQLGGQQAVESEGGY
jgi:hypothetical protein